MDCLIGFGSGLIVPELTLLATEMSFNFHGASPDYPGRDPHHWAAYDCASTYGATAHWMWPKVDEGPICATLLFGMSAGSGPKDYHEAGEAAARALFAARVPHMVKHGSADNSMKWTGKKRSRADLIKMCDMRGLNAAEIERRRKAFSGFEAHFVF